MNLMYRVKVYVESKWAVHLLSAWITSIMTLVHFGIGFAILIGGVRRFSGHTYQPLIDLANGNLWWWGLAFIFSAALMVTPFRWPIIVGLWFGMVWMFMWTAAFTVSVIRYESADAIMVPVFSGFTLINVALLTARVLDKNAE